MDDLRQTSDEEFYERVKPQLERLEVVRQAKLRLYKLRMKIAMFVSPAVFPLTGFIDWWLLRLQSGNDDSAAGLTVIAAGALYAWVTQPKRQYAKAYKTDILPKIARLFGDMIYDADGRIPMEDMKPFKIVPNHDRYEAEDYFAGTYRGARIQFSEINLKERRRSKRRTYYVSVFKGLAIMVSLGREKFAGHTVLLSNTTGLVQWFRKKTLDLDRADLVDPAFEKKYDVYTNDQVEARYLIHPLMIEKIKGMADAYGAQDILTGYMRDSVLILLKSSKDYFEPAGIHVPATEPASLRGMKHEIGQVLDLIDQMEQYDAAAAHKVA